MFRIVALLVFVGTLASFFLIFRKSGQWAGFMPGIRNFIQTLRKDLKERGVRPNFRPLLYLICLLMFMILAGTGFFSALILGQAMTGVLLMLHVIVAPLFAVGLAVGALLWAHQHQFSFEEWHWLAANIKKPRELFGPHYDFWRKMCFWLILMLSLPAIFSIVFSMYPFFGTDGQHYLLNVHRYSVLILSVLVMFHSYWVILESQSRPKK